MHERVYPERGLGFVAEFYVDLDYGPDGRLIITREHEAWDPAVAAERALRAVREGVVRTTAGNDVPVKADCLCVHSDTPGAVAVAAAVRAPSSRISREAAPDRQSRRDRLPHHPQRQGARAGDGRRLLRSRPQRAACRAGRPRRRHRPGQAGRELSRHRPADRGGCARPAPTPSIPATASCPRTPPSPRRSLAAGATWVGPAPDAIAAMGDKERARRLAAEAGVPIVPGSRRFAARRHRRPGRSGGARSAIRCWSRRRPAAAASACAGSTGRSSWSRRSTATQALAAKAFGDGTIYLERLVAPARHVEIQVFGFGDGRADPPVRARMLDPAPLPEDRRGKSPAPGLRPRPAAAHGRGRRRAGRQRTLSPAPARSSSSLGAEPASSSSSR